MTRTSTKPADTALDVVGAGLDLRALLADRLTRPGGPTTIRGAIDAVRARVDRAEAVAIAAGLLPDPHAPRVVTCWCGATFTTTNPTRKTCGGPCSQPAHRYRGDPEYRAIILARSNRRNAELRMSNAGR